MKAPIKVGFYVFFPGGGIGRYTHELMRTLGRRPDVRVDLICAPDYEWKNAPEYVAWDHLRSLAHSVPTIRRLNFLRGQFVNPRRAVQYAIDRDLDVLHFSNINHLTLPIWYPKLLDSGVKVVASVHDVLRLKSVVNSAWEDRQLRSFYRRAHALFVHSAYQVDELVRFADVSPHKVHVVPHGPYPHGPVYGSKSQLRSKWDLPEGRQIALFFGQIRDEKNLDRFLRAVSLSTARPYVVVAGRSGTRHCGIQHYRQLARDLGIVDSTKFLDRYILDDEVGELFVACDWVALPYRNRFTSQSGVLNTAAYYERPVLASSAPVLKETVQQGGIGVVCTDDTVAALTEGVELMCKRITAGRSQFEFEQYRTEFSWDENARKTTEAYTALLGVRKR